ncbi:hypothetical protein Athai_67160 [Actinocatenispora thailandica]|uniref:Uncharacterized protein n=1 Tax=Actinocatenispora thailandica TaxID=227318 RepID=A0A7R7I0E9_9ACTN|nr:hypothetical protein [Actinocatenispora thailandica]BCJ39213.1 hypothetical protein Athai_67160 [Actinocatenispora thailandica]
MVQLITVALIAGAAAVFFHSAFQVLLPGVVDETGLAEGNAKLLGSREVAQVSGPELGGLIAQAGGPVIGLLANAASFAVSLCCLTAMQRHHAIAGPATRPTRACSPVYASPGTTPSQPALQARRHQNARSMPPKSGFTSINPSNDPSRAKQFGRLLTTAT